MIIIIMIMIIVITTIHFLSTKGLASWYPWTYPCRVIIIETHHWHITPLCSDQETDGSQ